MRNLLKSEDCPVEARKFQNEILSIVLNFFENQKLSGEVRWSNFNKTRISTCTGLYEKHPSCTLIACTTDDKYFIAFSGRIVDESVELRILLNNKDGKPSVQEQQLKSFKISPEQETIHRQKF